MSYQTLMRFFLYNIKNILKKSGNQTVLVPVDFHCIIYPYNGIQWEPSTVWLPTILLNILFYVQQKRE